MPKALPRTVLSDTDAHARPGRSLDWRKKMSDHVAYALLVYTGLQIFVTMSLLKTGNGSSLPYLGLVFLIVAIIPACRMLEGRWDRLTDGQAANPELFDAFRKDCAALWLCAIGLPFVLTAGYKGLEALF
ncbi:hypothetical protein [Altericroceibacterium xinjiangense]|uniref:hypothetical protein n=1 Tax=Altericroceibacterium xinjiangense TaxID=762261 RepID=UPI001F4A006C|nr:hypothetical protein [Altericroceibacterium xinjiangense]